MKKPISFVCLCAFFIVAFAGAAHAAERIGHLTIMDTDKHASAAVIERKGKTVYPDGPQVAIFDGDVVIPAENARVRFTAMRRCTYPVRERMLLTADKGCDNPSAFVPPITGILAEEKVTTIAIERGDGQTYFLLPAFVKIWLSDKDETSALMTKMRTLLSGLLFINMVSDRSEADIIIRSRRTPGIDEELAFTLAAGDKAISPSPSTFEFLFPSQKDAFIAALYNWVNYHGINALKSGEPWPGASCRVEVRSATPKDGGKLLDRFNLIRDGEIKSYPERVRLDFEIHNKSPEAMYAYMLHYAPTGEISLLNEPSPTFHPLVPAGEKRKVPTAWVTDHSEEHFRIVYSRTKLDFSAWVQNRIGESLPGKYIIHPPFHTDWTTIGARIRTQ